MTRPRDLLLHPIALAAIALLVLNDHVLERAMPGWWTGKLSDFAGLTFFPLLLAALVDGVRRARDPRALVRAASIATAIVFALVKTRPLATDAFRCALGGLQWPLAAAQAMIAGHAIHAPVPVAAVTDPTDLIALPFAAIAIVLARAEATRPIAGVAVPARP